MVAGGNNPSLSSSEKKRLRDRKGQKKLKEKRDKHIQALELRVAICEQHHGTDTKGKLLSIVNHLYRENQALRARQERLRSVLTSFEREDAAVPIYPLPSMADIDPASLPGPDETCSANQEPHISVLPNQAPTENCNHAIRPETLSLIDPEPKNLPWVEPLDTVPTSIRPEAVCPPIFESSSTIPAWCLLPMSSDHANQTVLPGTCSWLEYPDFVAACPAKPSPLDLLHGTRCNFLADQIHRSLRRRAIRDAECVALGWLMYQFNRWTVSPSSSTFACLCPFQCPIKIQLQQDHPRAIDMVIWPQLRANLLRNWTNYDLVELTAYMSCCTKLRWPWGQAILERDANDDLQIRQDYFDIFTRESGWGLTSEFIERYSELLEGMDIETVRFQLTLPHKDT